MSLTWRALDLDALSMAFLALGWSFSNQGRLRRLCRLGMELTTIRARRIIFQSSEDALHTHKQFTELVTSQPTQQALLPGAHARVSNRVSILRFPRPINSPRALFAELDFPGYAM